MRRSWSRNRRCLFLLAACSLLTIEPRFAAAIETPPEPKSSNGASDAAAKGDSTTGAATKGDPAAGATAAGPAAAAFDRQFAEWKSLLADIRKVQEQFQIAADKKSRTALTEKFERLLAQGHEMAPKLIVAAENAYAENPQAAKLADFLVAVAIDDVRAGTSDSSGTSDGNDKYEEAYRIAKALVAAGNKTPAVYNSLGVSAFCVNDYELARKYLNLAADQKTLNKSGKNFLAVLDNTEKDWAKESEVRAAEAKADDLPRVKLVTSKGDIVVELFENEAPNTVANFISLVERGFYKDTTFFRVLPNFMAQGGSPTGENTGGPGYKIACECYRPDYRRHFRGSLSMAKAQARDTGGSQFFMTFVPTVMLNGQHTVFGRIIEGMEVLEKIQRIDPEKPSGAQPDRILDAVVLRKRSHAYVPVKVGE